MKNTTEDLSDEQLVELVRSEDQELYAELVGRYQEKLLRYAGYFLRDRGRAEDVVQEAFIKAFINLRGFNTKKSFSSWIYRIVHNGALNYIKKYRRELPLDEPFLQRLATRDRGPEEILEKEEAEELLGECLDQLPLKYSAPLVLFYLEEKSYAEISNVLRISVGTVGTRLRRGKKLARGICTQEGGKNYGRK